MAHPSDFLRDYVSETQYIGSFIANTNVPTGTPFSPSDIAGLTLWTRPNLGYTQSSGLLAGWADQSGNSNDFSQATAGNRPQVINAVKNGLPAVRFAAGKSISTAGFTLDQPLTIFVVGEMLADTMMGFLNALVAGDRDISFINFETLRTNSGVITDIVIPAINEFRIMTIIIDGALSRIRMNGFDIAIFDSGANNGSGFMIGTDFDGFLGELLAYNVRLTASQMRQVEVYLGREWDIDTITFLPAGNIYDGAEVGDFNGFTSILSAQTVQYNPGQTLMLIYNHVLDSPINNEILIGSSAGAYGVGNGWVIVKGQAVPNVYLEITNGGAATAIAVANPGVNLVVIRWNALDNHVWCSYNGTPPFDANVMPSTTYDSSVRSSIGSLLPGDTQFYLRNGGVLAWGILDHEASDAEIQSWTTIGNKNRLALPDSFVQDADCLVNWNAYTDWDGISPTTTSGGSAPVTYTVDSGISRTDLSEIRIVPSPPMYHDSKIEDPQELAVRRNAYARLSFTTSMQRLGVEVATTMADSFGALYASIGIHSDNVYDQDIELPNTQPNPRLFDVTLPVGADKTIDLYEGPQALLGPIIHGTYVSAIRIPLDGTVINNAAPVNRLLLSGDSIITAFQTTIPQQYAIPPLLRADFPGGVTMYGWGSLSLHDLAATPELIAQTAALIALMLDGSGTNRWWNGLGTNDYGLAPWTAVNFGIGYATLVDAVIALRPNVIIYCQTPIQRIAPATEAANGWGDTLDDYRTQITNLANARPANCVAVDGAAGNIVSNVNMYSDGIHELNAGAAQHKAFIKDTIGY